MQYYRHFGLQGPLFRRVTPWQPLYMSAAHRETLTALEWGLCHESSPFTLLVGEPGSGKTALLHAIVARGFDQVRTAMISNPLLPFDEFVREVLHQFGIGAGPGRPALLDAFDALLAAIEPGGRVVIAIDGAQAMSDSMLEELDLLSNRDRRADNPLHLILVARRDLARRLLEPGLTRLNDQIGVRATLEQMSRNESFEYVDYWIRKGGGRLYDVFGRQPLATLVDHAGGLPQRLNVLCHNALLLAYSRGCRKVDLVTARKVAADYQSVIGADPSGNHRCLIRDNYAT